MTLDQHDKENNFDAAWKLDHYFETGADALRIIVDSLVQGLKSPPQNILDFPCGSGRVTRHLRAFFPDARIVASDLYDPHVRFCEQVLGAEGWMSKESFDDLTFPTAFDVIFCGSLLTHLPEDGFCAALRLISRSLSPTGVAIVTLQGRHAEFVQRRKYKVIEDERFGIAEQSVRDSGFGYVDYNTDILTQYWFRQRHYGVSLSRPHWVLRQIEQDYTIRLLSYCERGWDGSQDVLVFGKPAVNAWMRPGDAEDDTAEAARA